MYTAHGYHIPGTDFADPEPPKGRCGGPGLCSICSREVSHMNNHPSTSEPAEYKTFVRKPFVVEAVRVTIYNIEELSQFIGTLKYKENGFPYVEVDREKVPNVDQVFPGYWMTRMGNNIRCYSRKVFDEQFSEVTPEISSWIESLETPSLSAVKD